MCLCNPPEISQGTFRSRLVDNCKPEGGILCLPVKIEEKKENTH